MSEIPEKVYNILLTERGQSPVEIYRQVDQGSLVSTRFALRNLVKEGRCRYEGDDLFRRYFKVEK
jgi:hypothetical protein